MPHYSPHFTSFCGSLDEMAMAQRITLSKDTALEAREVHLVPCHINYSGPAPVSEYFQSTPIPPSETAITDERNGQNQRLAYFRGRKLLGVATPLPDGYVGTIYTPSRAETVSTSTNGRETTRGDGRLRTSRDVSSDGLEGEEDEEDEDEMEELSTWTPKATFHTLVEYGNHALPEPKLAEWIALAHAIHGKSEARP
ncbi:Ribonuclease H2 complex subunit [Taphrina deformans PYCC 5710]|uniref:Ribonuclease H2 complex subunit n=1 Tax=Taphrina deformans (strain PYCC 5710 / ATCC 11124 / CBS 356.35 / IMI 108563 / JCM 9778 / NBRC 8474) TaxID=1097556 RepID=R4XCC7_TAPDE|nr:Ribonuclease H2 complex subunit [Taphrina deformans PYCC 5710]|eukprot:CCG82026.1 Ribonuclease H2 complex subunit [Taphrina deformans PYCC 5710]